MEGLLFFFIVLVGVLFMSMIGSWVTDNIDGLFLSAIGVLSILFVISLGAISGEKQVEYSVIHPDQYEYVKTTNHTHTVFILSDIQDLDDPEYNTEDTVVYNHIGDTSRVKVVVRNSINYIGNITWREVDVIVEN